MGEILIKEWRKLSNEGLRDLYSLPCTIRAIKYRKVKEAGQYFRKQKMSRLERRFVRS